MAEKETKLSVFDYANEDNIQDIIAKAGTVDDNIVKAAAEKIAKERKEQVTQELIEVVQEAEFVVKATALQVRRSNRVNQRNKAYMKELDTMTTEMKSGKMSIPDWKRKTQELKKQADKDIIEIDNDIDRSQKELDKIFPSSWRYRNSWASGNLLLRK